jgi:hypothetical protein
MRTRLATALFGMSICLGTTAGLRPVAAQDMMTVGELVHHCQTNSTQCGQDFSTTQISMAFLWGGTCIPPKQVRQQTEIAVLRWLIKHPELANEDAADGIADAVSELWPCANQ